MDTDNGIGAPCRGTFLERYISPAWNAGLHADFIIHEMRIQFPIAQGLHQPWNSLQFDIAFLYNPNRVPNCNLCNPNEIPIQFGISLPFHWHFIMMKFAISRSGPSELVNPEDLQTLPRKDPSRRTWWRRQPSPPSSSQKSCQKPSFLQR